MRRGLAACCLCAALAAQSILADGVSRAVEPVAGGCRVTLAWEFSGKVESDLVVEERFAAGWTVDDATMPLGSLDASWFSGNVVRFAVKPALLVQPGSISFTVLAGGGATVGAVVGDWKIYLDGTLRKGGVAGARELAALPGEVSEIGGLPSGSLGSGPSATATPIAITAFKVVGGGIELSYSGEGKAGTLVVEGCEGLGMAWAEIRRMAVSAGDGKVSLSSDEAGECRFFKMKLFAEGE